MVQTPQIPPPIAFTIAGLKMLEDKSLPVPSVSGLILQLLYMTQQRTSERLVYFMQGNFSQGTYTALQHTTL